MSNPGEGDATPIESVRQLADYIAVGCKPRSAFRIGTEHEKIVFQTDDLRPVPYTGSRGIRAIMEELIAQALANACEGGRREGLEEAAKCADDVLRSGWETDFKFEVLPRLIDQIRKLAKEGKRENQAP